MLVCYLTRLLAQSVSFERARFIHYMQSFVTHTHLGYHTFVYDYNAFKFSLSFRVSHARGCVNGQKRFGSIVETLECRNLLGMIDIAFHTSAPIGGLYCKIFTLI